MAQEVTSQEPTMRVSQPPRTNTLRIKEQFANQRRVCDVRGCLSMWQLQHIQYALKYLLFLTKAEWIVPYT